MSSHTRATIEDLYNAEGKAELVDGEIVTRSDGIISPFTQVVNGLIISGLEHI